MRQGFHGFGEEWGYVGVGVGELAVVLACVVVCLHLLYAGFLLL